MLLQELETGKVQSDVQVQPKKAVTTTDDISADMMKIQAHEKMYQAALTAAKEKGESGKIRRFERALHTIASMSKDALAGRVINLDHLPPEVSLPPAGGHRVLDDRYQVEQELVGRDPPKHTTTSMNLA